MLFKEAISKRIIELCDKNNYSINKLAEYSTIPPSTLRDLVGNGVNNPSCYVIYKICKTFKISIKEFFDNDLFNYENIDD